MSKISQHNRFAVAVGKVLWELISAFVPALIIALFVNVYIAEAAMVEAGPSMQPNLYIGYRVMMEKVSYRFGLPQRGDVVIVDRPGNETNLIKRVIGLPGEVIEVHQGRVWIDGLQLEEPWVQEYGGSSYRAEKIPPGYIFIIGDNRKVSHDSRAIGPVALESVRGHVLLIYWPPGEARLFP